MNGIGPTPKSKFWQNEIYEEAAKWVQNSLGKSWYIFKIIMEISYIC